MNTYLKIVNINLGIARVPLTQWEFKPMLCESLVISGKWYLVMSYEL